MDNFDFSNPASFHALLTNPVPKGEIHCDGQFGPWQADDPSQTAVSANYTFYNADMGTLKGLKGTLSSEGKFSGPLDYLNVEGKTDIPNFALRTSDHPMALQTDFSAVVDGTNGNTYLNIVTARFLHTTLVTKGKVVDEYPNVKGRTIVMDTFSKSARIEDLLFLAVKSNPPVMTGTANLKAKILIPEGNEDLIERMKIDGQFGVGEAEFTSDSVQGKINSLSRRAQGKPKDTELTAVSELQGAFKMGGGEIDFSRLSFSVPGADIDLAGNYGVDSGALNFRGKLLLQAKLSQTVTGVKSFFLKAVDPFFKGKNGEKAGTVLPIKITGTKDHPAFGLDFHDKANKHEGKDQSAKTRSTSRRAIKARIKLPAHRSELFYCPPLFRLFFVEGVEACLGALLVLRARAAARADRADHFSVQHDRQAALYGGDVIQGDHVRLAHIDRVLEGLGWPLEVKSGARLALRHLDASDLRAVHAAQVHEVSSVIDDHKNHGPVVLGSFRLAGCGHFLRERQTHRFFFDKLRRSRACAMQSIEAIPSIKANTFSFISDPPCGRA